MARELQIALRIENVMNKNILVGLTILLAIGAQAQTLKDAKKKAENERYELAKADFKTLVQKDPANVENPFFYGNFLVTLEDNAGAIEQFKAAASRNAEDKLAQVSGAKAKYFEGDTTAAGQTFAALLKSTKMKNVCVLLRIAETYATGPVKNLPLAEKYLNRVIELEPNNIEALQLLGDVIIDQSTTRVSQAVEKYNAVLKLEPTNVVAIVKKAYIYERVNNADAAIDGYEQAIKIDPTFGPAYRHEAEIQMKEKKDYEKSAALWTKYLELNNDPEARFRYATSLYIGKKYDMALNEVNTIEKSGMSTIFTKRMKFYALYELGAAGDSLKLKESLTAANDFFGTAKPEKLITSDYQTLANIYTKMGNTAEALKTIEKLAVINKESAATQLTQIASAAGKAKDYKTMIAAYTQKDKVAPELMTYTEYYDLGKAYYFSTPPDYALADSSLAKAMKLKPEYAMIYIWRGRALSQMDLDLNNRNWKPQPYYEQFLSVLSEADKANAAYKDYITEASRYLGDYYVNSAAKDPVKAKMHWQQVLTNDPNDKQAQIYFKSH